MAASELSDNPSDPKRFQIISANDEVIICGSVRLHNRSELVKNLQIETATSGQPDIALVLAAYRKWGADCGTHLLGEFAFAIWDNPQQKLSCFRDHIGFRPFLYWYSGSRFVFSTDIRAILATPGVARELNRRKFAGVIIPYGEELHDEDTFHRGILSLPNGCVLIVDRRGSQKRRYWEPRILPELIPRKSEEIIEALHELLVNAVLCRIDDDTPFTAELSGGLDSSGIVGVAARYLEKRGKTLVTVSSVVAEDSKGKFRDERPFIDEFRSWPNIRIEYVAANGRGPFDHIEDPAEFVVTPVRASNAFLHDARKEVALRYGARLRLRGLLGELGPTHRGDRYLVELAVKLRWGTLTQQLRQLRAVQGIRPFRHLAARFLELTRRAGGSVASNGIPLTREMSAAGDALPVFRCSTVYQQKYQRAALQRVLRGHSPRRDHVNQDGSWYTYPWLDKRVLEFCLAAPPELKIRNGYHRNLIRTALKDELPEKIRWRTDKCIASPDFNARYNSQLAKAREFLAAIGPKDPVRTAIDVDRLVGLAKPVDPNRRDWAAAHVLPQSIYAICFLRQFPEFRP
jgi:asparagine synthase (glutamine-hydrolysing)